MFSPRARGPSQAQGQEGLVRPRPESAKSSAWRRMLQPGGCQRGVAGYSRAWWPYVRSANSMGTMGHMTVIRGAVATVNHGVR